MYKMNYIENFNKAALDSKLDIAITWFKKETNEHEREIREIWWYEIILNKEESNFKIMIDETHTITVQHQDGKFVFINNHEWIINWWFLKDIEESITLKENEILEWNENVNTLNRIIKFYLGYSNDEEKTAFHDEESLNKVAKLFEIISENK